MSNPAARATFGHQLTLFGSAIVCAVLLLMPVPPAKASGGLSSHIEIDGDGFEATIKRPGYRLELEIDGEATFTADESDLASLSAGGEFELIEKKAGVTHRYQVEADRGGKLTREYSRDGAAQAMDAAGRTWLKAALLAAFRTTGLDAEARAGRLLARGSGTLLDEIAALESDFVRSQYLRTALAAPGLDAQATQRAFALTTEIGSDFEQRRALSAALGPRSLDAARATALLTAARHIGSDFELATLLVEAAPRLPADAAVIAAWREAVGGVQSDFEMRRAIEAAFESAPAGYRRAAFEAAAAIGSDFELRVALDAGAKVSAKDPALVAAHLTSAKQIGSDFELRVALTRIAPQLERDPVLLGLYLDCVERMGSDFEARQALTAIAPQLSVGSPSGKRYVELARGMGEFERGQALAALLDAGAL
jgi:hypothetical protein